MEDNGKQNSQAKKNVDNLPSQLLDFTNQLLDNLTSRSRSGGDPHDVSAVPDSSGKSLESSRDGGQSLKTPCHTCNLRDLGHLRELMYANALESFCRLVDQIDQGAPAASAAENTKNIPILREGQSGTCSSSAHKIDHPPQKDLESMYASSLDSIFKSKGKSSSKRHKKQGGKESPSKTRGASQNPEEEKNPRAASGSDIAAFRCPPKDIQIGDLTNSKIPSAGKGVTIVNAKNVFINFIRGEGRGVSIGVPGAFHYDGPCAQPGHDHSADLLTARCPSRRSSSKQSCDLADMLTSPKTDPRLHTPDSDRKRFTSVKWGPGNEVRTTVRSRHSTVLEDANMRTARAHSPTRNDGEPMQFDATFRMRGHKYGPTHRLMIEADLLGKCLTKLKLNGASCRI